MMLAAFMLQATASLAQLVPDSHFRIVSIPDPLNPAAIAGTLTDPSGNAIPNAAVTLYRAGTPFPIDYAYTDVNGDYYFSSLSGGRYKLYFDSGYTDLVPEYYNNKPSLGTADVIELASTDIVTGINASLDIRGRISGNVRTFEGGAAAGVTVHAIKKGTQYSYASDIVDAAGDYLITNLPQAEYRVYFDGSLSTANVLNEYYNDTKIFGSADLLRVVNNGTLTSIDAVLDRGAVIRGKLRSVDGSPLSYPQVTLYEGTFDSYLGAEYPGASGDFEFNKLAAGVYKLHFQSYGGYAAEWYDNAENQPSADRLIIATAETIDLSDVVLDRLGEIRGNVRSYTGESLGSVYVRALSALNDNFISGTFTNASGDYTLMSLPAGKYKVQFDPSYTGKALSPEYFDDKVSSASADQIAVLNNSVVTSVDAVLESAGTISGYISTSAGQPAPYSYVYLYKADNSMWYYRYAFAGFNGAYLLDRLEPGTYKLFVDPGYYNSGWSEEWYENKRDMASADIITLTPESNSASIDIELEPLGSIEGRVVDESGGPIQSVQVSVQCEALDMQYCAYAYTDTQGWYQVTGLDGGNYRVLFSPPYYRPDLLSEYFRDASAADSAQLVTVVRGERTTSIDATLDVEGVIEGRVLDTYGQVLTYYTTVEAYPSTGDGGPVAVTYANYGGAYQLGGLRSGDYKVRFDPGYYNDNYFEQWFSGRSGRASADLVHAEQGELTGSVDAVLVCKVCRDAYEPDDTVSDAGIILPDSAPQHRSHFPVGELDMVMFTASADMPYKIVVSGDAAQPAFYPTVALLSGDGATILDSSTTFDPRKASLTYRATSDGALLLRISSTSYYAPASYDLKLVTLGLISGNVRSTSGDPLTNVTVEYRDMISGELVQDTRTDATGDHVSEPLPSGTYKVFFNARSGAQDEWYDNQVSAMSADTVTVRGNSITSSIDAVIDAPLQVSIETIPASPDAQHGYYRTIPQIILTPSRSGQVYYKWGEGSTFRQYVAPLIAPEGATILSYYAEDQTGFRSTLASADIKVDTSRPVDPLVWSISHTPRVWSSQTYIEMGLSGAYDPTGSLDGYSYMYSKDIPATPDLIPDVSWNAASFTAGPLTTGKWYYTMYTLDLAGNKSIGRIAGPYYIETNRPQTWLTEEPPATSDTPSVSFSWTGSDDVTAVNSLKFSKELFLMGGSDEAAWSSPDTAKSIRFNELNNGEYIFGVRAHDLAGNIDPYPAVSRFVVRFRERSEEIDPGVVLDNGCWEDRSDPQFSGEHVAVSLKKGCAAKFSFTGTRVDVVSASGPQLGKAKIYVDSVLSRTVDLYAARRNYQETVFTRTGMKRGVHTIRLEPSGSKNSRSSGYAVALDAFDVSG